MSLSSLLVVDVFFRKQCNTYTASGNLETYITRNQPSSKLMRIAFVPAPTISNRFQLSGSRPTCTMLSWWPAFSRAADVNISSFLMSFSDESRQLIGFSAMQLRPILYQILYT